MPNEDVNKILKENEDQLNASKANEGEEGKDIVEENNSYKEQTDEQMAQESQQAATGDNAAGEEVAKPDSRYGKIKAISVANGLAQDRYFEPIGMEEYRATSDLDAYSRDASAAAAQFERIAAKIDVEATQMVENGDKSIIGHSNEASVYSKMSNIAAKTVTNELVKYPISRIDARTIGTLLRQPSNVMLFGGDYVAGIHDVLKGFASGDFTKACKHNSQIAFNLLDSKGRVVPNSFVTPKNGKFIVTGVNPYVKKNASNMKAITSKDTGKTTGRLNESTNKIHPVTYYCASDDKQANLFEVKDVTSIMESIFNATKDVVENLSCNKSRMQFGLYEELNSQFNEICNQIPLTSDEAKDWPDFHYERNRSTLWMGEMNIGDNTTSCKNDPSAFFRFMQAIADSDKYIPMAMLSTQNVKNALLFNKGMSGKQRTNAWFDDYSGLSVKQTGIGTHTDATRDIRLPNLVPFMRYLTPAGAFKLPGQIMYQHRELTNKINAYAELLKTDPTLTKVMDSILVTKDFVDELSYIMSCGRVTDNDDVTSNGIAKLPGICDVILDFDPNDLVNNTGSENTTKWYPCCGYANLIEDKTGPGSSRVTFCILPSWLEILIHFFQSERWEKMLCVDLSATERSLGQAWDDFVANTGSKNLLCWLMNGYNNNNHAWPSDNARRYIPTQLDFYKGSLFGFMLSEAYIQTSDFVFGKSARFNAYNSRYLIAVNKEAFGFKPILQGFYDMTLKTAIDNIMNNDALKFFTKAQRFKEIPVLYADACKRFLNSNQAVVAYTTEVYGETSGVNHFTNLEAVAYPKLALFELMQSTAGFSFYSKLKNSNDKLDKTDLPYTNDNESDLKLSPLFNAKAIFDKLDTKTAAETGWSSQFGDKFLVNAQVPGFSIRRNLFVKLGEFDTTEFKGIERMTVTNKVTNFDADEAKYNHSNDLSKVIYTGDKFFIPTYDYLKVYVDKGKSNDYTITNESKYYDIGLLPEDEITPHADNNDAYSAHTPVIHGIFKHESYTKVIAADDPLYDNDDAITFEVHDSNPSWCQERTSVDYNSIMIRRMIRPSLYGYKRDCAYGATTLLSDFTGRLFDSAAIADDAKDASFIDYGYLPEIIGAEPNAANTAWDVLASVDSDYEQEIANYKYYIRQRLFVGAPVSYVGANTAYDINWFFKLGNWIIPDTSGDTSSSAHITRSKRLSVAIEDERNYLLDYYKMNSIMNCLAKWTYNASTKPEKIHVHPNEIYSNGYLSRYNFNDYLIWVIGRPTIKLNEKWKNAMNTIPLFYLQYNENTKKEEVE